MGLRTEDQVRNQAGMTLGFIDAEGNDVETTEYLSGVGQTTTFIQLGKKLGITDFNGISDKPDGWFLPFNQNAVAVVLEAKLMILTEQKSFWMEKIMMVYMGREIFHSPLI